MGKQNTKWFLVFAENAQISDIEKIEVQGIDADGNNVGNTITVSDEESIREFVSALKTIEEYNTYHPTQEKRIKVKIWLLEKNQMIELEGYTLSGEGRVFYVANLRIEPRMWKFGDGNQKFPAPSFYDWLEKIGMEL